MTAILGFLGLSMALWMGAWLIERGRIRISPLGALIGWLIYLQAVGFLAADCYQAVIGRLDRWPGHVERARREA